MSKKLRDKLSAKDKAYFKLAVWSALIAWMVFFFAYSLTMAKRLANPGWFSFWGPTWASVMTWVAPVWVAFTALLIICFIARYVSRKFKE